ncbi:sel1 repeat family protein [Pleomorphomonas sp. NRK KF1]|uniref:SEL1-like repeat protein n=1 Tax=Pleomorphomonas sp. NRK KF1 TaxID=2943000 RepID=UPI002044A70F|nr:sel1 repeat family protein [Pleomorphomonas sp. NRK KF1]MCM5552155.1 sel1 repeat family protein [Pleomorphomonas sp. NRK KF1]
MARLELNSIDQLAGGAGATSDILYELGVMYAVGRDVEQNLIEAHKWFNIAAFRGSESAARYRRELADEMSSVEIAAAQREAREWISLH